MKMLPFKRLMPLFINQWMNHNFGLFYHHCLMASYELESTDLYCQHSWEDSIFQQIFNTFQRWFFPIVTSECSTMTKF